MDSRVIFRANCLKTHGRGTLPRSVSRFSSQGLWRSRISIRRWQPRKLSSQSRSRATALKHECSLLSIFNGGGGGKGEATIVIKPKRDTAGNVAPPDTLSISLVDSETGNRSRSVAVSGKKKWKGGDGGSMSVRIDMPVPKGFGSAGAIVITCKGKAAVYVVAVTVEGKRGWERSARRVIPCFSWVDERQRERVFFWGKGCLPFDTPKGLRKLRENELRGLKGIGTGERQLPERIYDFDVYNDLGEAPQTWSEVRGKGNGNNADKKDPARKVIGGSEELPYPRRLRTGRKMGRNGAREARVEHASLGSIYVPADDDFAPEKLANFEREVCKTRNDLPGKVKSFMIQNGLKFRSMRDVSKIYANGTEDPFGLELPASGALDGDTPGVYGLNSDEEFGRQRVAGMNPAAIQAVKFMPKGCKITGRQVTREALEGKTFKERIRQGGRIFMIDYHDIYMKFLKKINGMGRVVQYAPRCVLYLTDAGTLLPVAIELNNTTNEPKVYTPEKSSPTDWALAKAHFLAADSAFHQLYTHFTRCHANAEPFVIATRRQLSAMHPVHRLLVPHFKDTLRTNAIARQMLINAGGVVEATSNPGKYCMELASAVYGKYFRFASEGLPEDLKRRGMAKETKDGDFHLTLEDYPYATDGLLIWSAIETWVLSYLNIYYKESLDVTSDKELMAWWEEIQLNGHPDIVAFGLASASEMWPRLENIYDLTGILTTIIWMVSGHHAAVDLGQYAYGDFFLNQPTLTVQRMPFTKKANGENGAPLDEEVYLDTVNPLPEAIRWSATSKILSTHHPGEQYLGEEIPQWFSDEVVLEEFATFRTDLRKAGEKMKERNEKGDSPLRISERKLPYTELCPKVDNESVGVKGIPNSVSI